VVGILPRDVSKSSITNNLGEGFELGPHFYRLTDKIVILWLVVNPVKVLSSAGLLAIGRERKAAAYFRRLMVGMNRAAAPKLLPVHIFI